MDVNGFTYASIGEECISSHRTEHREGLHHMDQCELCRDETYLGSIDNGAQDTYSFALVATAAAMCYLCVSAG